MLRQFPEDSIKAGNKDQTKERTVLASAGEGKATDEGDLYVNSMDLAASGGALANCQL